MIRSLLHRNTRAAIGHAAACGCPACACFGPWCLVCTVTFLSEFSPLFRSVISEYCPPTIKKMAIIQCQSMVDQDHELIVGGFHSEVALTMTRGAPRSRLRGGRLHVGVRRRPQLLPRIRVTLLLLLVELHSTPCLCSSFFRSAISAVCDVYWYTLL